MSNVTVTWKGDEFMRRLHAPGGAVDQGLTAAAERLSNTIVSSMGRNHGGKPSQPGAFPNSQSGMLSRQFTHTPGHKGVAYVNNFAPYARLLAKGGLIRPKSARMLCWPVSREAKRAVVRFNGNQRLAIDALRRSGKMVKMPRRSGGWLIGKKIGGKNARIEWQFIMAPMVYIAPRPWHTLGIAKARDAMRRAFVRTSARVMKAGSA